MSHKYLWILFLIVIAVRQLFANGKCEMIKYLLLVSSKSKERSLFKMTRYIKVQNATDSIIE